MTFLLRAHDSHHVFPVKSHALHYCGSSQVALKADNFDMKIDIPIYFLSMLIDVLSIVLPL